MILKNRSIALYRIRNQVSVPTSLESGNLVQLVEPPLPQCVQLADRYKRLSTFGSYKPQQQYGLSYKYSL
jgi:hypothetical protein